MLYKGQVTSPHMPLKQVNQPPNPLQPPMTFFPDVSTQPFNFPPNIVLGPYSPSMHSAAGAKQQHQQQQHQQQQHQQQQHQQQQAMSMQHLDRLWNSMPYPPGMPPLNATTAIPRQSMSPSMPGTVPLNPRSPSSSPSVNTKLQQTAPKPVFYVHKESQAVQKTETSQIFMEKSETIISGVKSPATQQAPTLQQPAQQPQSPTIPQQQQRKPSKEGSPAESLGGAATSPKQGDKQTAGQRGRGQGGRRGQRGGPGGRGGQRGRPQGDVKGDYTPGSPQKTNKFSKQKQQSDKSDSANLTWQQKEFL